VNVAIEILNKLSNFIDWLIIRLVFILMLCLVITTTLQIVFRVFFDALTWSEELSRYFLVWITFFAATIAYKRGSHIAINFVVVKLESKFKFLITIFQYIVSILFFSILFYYSWKMIQLQFFQTSPAMSLPMQYIYSCITISMIIMIIHALAALGKEIVNYYD